MNHAELVDRYLKGIEILTNAVQGVSPAILDKTPAPGKWSIRQYAVHVADTELVMTVRMRLIAAEPGATVTVFDQERWASQLNYEKQPIEDVLAMFRGARIATANMLRAITPEIWDNKGVHPKRGEVTVSEILELCTNHCEKHAQTIRELRDRFGIAANA